jgi:hypothetical protein
VVGKSGVDFEGEPLVPFRDALNEQLHLVGVMISRERWHAGPTAAGLGGSLAAGHYPYDSGTDGRCSGDIRGDDRSWVRACRTVPRNVRNL